MLKVDNLNKVEVLNALKFSWCCSDVFITNSETYKPSYG